MKFAFFLSVCVLTSCRQHTDESSCDELNRYAQPGIVISDNEPRCAELLDFARTVPGRYGMDFSTWLSTVPAQGSDLLLDAIEALTGGKWTPTSFASEPSVIPCGSGFKITDAYWSTSLLNRIVTRRRPEQLYVSLAIEIVGNVATIRISQDFNCDGQLGTFELAGEFKTGTIVTGWKPQGVAKVPELDE